MVDGVKQMTGPGACGSLAPDGADDLLTRLYLEPSSRCNLSCTMCFRNSWQGEAFSDMALATFNQVLKTAPASVATIFLGGMGEPLLHPDILTMVAEISRTGRRAELLTNAYLLTPALSEKLLAAGLKKLWISIDSFEAAGYDQIRQRSDFGQIKAHLKAFNLARSQAPGPVELGINFVLMKSNVGQLRLIPDFIRSFGINEVNVSHLIPSDEISEKQVLYDRVLDWRLGLVDSHPAPVINLPMINWRDEKVMGGLQGLLSSTVACLNFSGQPLRRQASYCRFVQEGLAFVRHDGAVSPCPALLHSTAIFWEGRKKNFHHHSFGQADTGNLTAIWESDEYRAFRARGRRFDFSPCIHCSGCDLWGENELDCYGNQKPVCGGCLWAEGVISCP